jgi:hypothetical protein
MHGAGLYVWHEEEEKHAFGGRVEEGPHASSPWTWVVAVRLLEVCGIERCREGGRGSGVLRWSGEESGESCERRGCVVA